YVRGRPFAPEGVVLEAAEAAWADLAGDPDAAFDREIVLDGSEIAPTVTWGISPEHALPISATVPDPTRIDDPVRAAAVRDALAYM
ncbi:aconitase family protein, partial [Stenotrophomonas maltophilia]|uniref:aconitase family protein n=1 Tax=Stenotrophomonas maltophilia TaxID=40324 RepID=UPI001EF7BE24